MFSDKLTSTNPKPSRSLVVESHITAVLESIHRLKSHGSNIYFSLLHETFSPPVNMPIFKTWSFSACQPTCSSLNAASICIQLCSYSASPSAASNFHYPTQCACPTSTFHHQPPVSLFNPDLKPPLFIVFSTVMACINSLRDTGMTSRTTTRPLFLFWFFNKYVCYSCVV